MFANTRGRWPANSYEDEPGVQLSRGTCWWTRPWKEGGQPACFVQIGTKPPHFQLPWYLAPSVAHLLHTLLQLVESLFTLYLSVKTGRVRFVESCETTRWSDERLGYVLIAPLTAPLSLLSIVITLDTLLRWRGFTTTNLPTSSLPKVLKTATWWISSPLICRSWM